MPDAAISNTRAARPANPSLWIGGAILLSFSLLAILGERIAPHDPTAQDLFAIMEAPSRAHLLGADAVGRDILSRIIAGTRYTLSIAVASVFFASIGGVTLGAIAGYFGGLIDRVVTGFIDLLLTVPNLVLAIAVAAAAGASATGLTIAITATFIPPLARLVRSRVLELREEDFVAAAVTIGMSHTRILLRHVLPNAVTVIVIEMSLLAGQAVLLGSALGFLGLGVQPPASEWGAMLGASREFLTVAPHLVIAPGVAISLLVLGFNMLGDGLRDVFDPNIQS
jgi:ABC-type dipeptide/oligopeptide/nickel transport system permease subunit